MGSGAWRQADPLRGAVACNDDEDLPLSEQYNIGSGVGRQATAPRRAEAVCEEEEGTLFAAPIGSRRAAAALLAEIGHRMELLSLLFLLSLRLISDRRVEQKKL